MGNPKPKKPYTKSTDAQIAERVVEVTQLLMQGYTRANILRYATKWDMHSRQIDTYIALATQELKEINKSTIEETQAVILQGLWRLYRKHESRQPDLGRKILMDIAKLKGLDQVSISHTIRDEREMESVSDEELEVILSDESPTN